mgnify:CR=1 FL=1
MAKPSSARDQTAMVSIPTLDAKTRGVLADFGITLPASTAIRVWDSTAETRFIVIPMRAPGTEGWTEERLTALVTRDSMIGTGFAKNPGEIA